MIPRFYCPLPLVVGTAVDLPEGAAHHALRVLRLKAGDQVTLFNGEGGEFAATLERADARAAVARVAAWRDVERESPLAVTVVQGLASGERMDFALQKAVELGVAAVQPVMTTRSVTRLDAARADKRLAHWRQVAIAACEQCGRNRVPEVLPLQDLDDWLRAPTQAVMRLLFAADAAQAIGALARPAGAIELLVGAEGGLTDDETTAATRAQFVAVRIGPRVLRTETAALAALSALNALWGDWR
ncbi:MAG: 16S rRNA (uracil(1498)-N(3))-methyltransferase [Casimicrobiaceae bacterium]